MESSKIKSLKRAITSAWRVRPASHPRWIMALRGLFKNVVGKDLPLSAIPFAAIRTFFGDFIHIKRYGYKFTIDIRDSSTAVELVLDIYEPDEALLMRKLVRKGHYVVDIGANIGIHTLLLAQLVGENGQVLAIEPGARNYALLARNVEQNGLGNRVHTINGAVGAASGRGVLYLNQQNTLDHRLYAFSSPTASTGEAQSNESINVFTFDDLVRDWPRVDFIKVDIQGYECFAINGMMRSLFRYDDVTILTEFWPFGMLQAGSSPRGYLRIFHDAGFQLFEVCGAQLASVDPEELISRLEGTSDHVNLVASRRPIGHWR